MREIPLPPDAAISVQASGKDVEIVMRTEAGSRTYAVTSVTARELADLLVKAANAAAWGR